MMIDRREQYDTLLDELLLLIERKHELEEELEVLEDQMRRNGEWEVLIGQYLQLK